MTDATNRTHAFVKGPETHTCALCGLAVTSSIHGVPIEAREPAPVVLKRRRDGLDRDEVFKLISGYVVGCQVAVDTPNGIEIKPMPVYMQPAVGGGWRAQSGSGIAGRGGAWALVKIATPPGEKVLSTRYVTTKRDLLALLRHCPGVVCRSCRGTSASPEPYGGRWRAKTSCKACGDTGVNQLRGAP